MYIPLVYFGGTFDPVHQGHLRIALNICAYLKVDHVTLLPNVTQVYRKPAVANPIHRLTMLKIAIARYKNIVIDDREIQKDTFYSVDTALRLRQKYGSYRPIVMCLGIDSFNYFDCWYHWQDILSYVHLLVLNRPNISTHMNSKLIHWYQKNACFDTHILLQKPAGLIHFANLGKYNISATAVRSCFLTDSKISADFLNPAVFTYAIKQHLYRYE